MHIEDFDDYEPEDDLGRIEYKLKLSPRPTEERLEKLASQMAFRLREGDGEAIYELGIADSGEVIGLSPEEFSESVTVLHEVADRTNADITLLRETQVSMKSDKRVAEFLIRFKPQERASYPLEISVATIGNVDSGKSTLIGTLISGRLDDGEGSNAILVARHQHEVESGRTSSISTRLLGFDSTGAVVNHRRPQPTQQELIHRSAKLIRFIDLAGHEKYLKTTIYGLSGAEPDYACVVVDGNRGVQRMSREHLGLAALALKIPIFLVLTKKDMSPPHMWKKHLKDLKKLLKSPGLNMIPSQVRDMDDVAVISRKLHAGRLAPIFTLSSLTGEGFDLLKAFLNLLKKPPRWGIEREEFQNHSASDPFLLFIDEIFNVTGVGKVVSGIVQSGLAIPGMGVILGPDKRGGFANVRLRSIQSQRVQLKQALPGDYVSFALAFKGKPIRITKGQVLTTYNPYKAVTRFEAEVFVLHHPSTLRPNYNAQIHLKTIRSQAKVVQIYDKERLRSGDRARVLFEFIYSPQFLLEGFKFVFREGRTKGIGVVKKLY